jgi:sodium transport system permease protein
MKKAGLQIKDLKSIDEAEAKIKKGEVRLAVNFDNSFVGEPPYKIDAYFDPSDQKAQIALSVVEKAADATNEGITNTLLKEKGVNPDLSKSLRINRKEVKVGETKGSELLVQLIPYLIIIWCFYGAFSSASDIVSGEKERQTLETLLISPAPRNQIAMGKLFSLAFGGLTATLMALLGVLVVSVLPIESLKPIFKDGLGLTITGLFVTILTLLPTVMLFASLLLAVSAFARNTREAQTYLAQASIIVVLPAAFSQIIGLTDFAESKAVYMVPILNSTNVIRNAFMGRYDVAGIAITIGMGIVLATAAIAYSIKLFNRESILTRI